MSQLIVQALSHRYLSKKRDAEQMFDFFNGVIIADTDVEQVYEKLEQAIEDWLEADLKLGALGLLSGEPNHPFERVTINDQETIFKKLKAKKSYT